MSSGAADPYVLAEKEYCDTHPDVLDREQMVHDPVFQQILEEKQLEISKSDHTACDKTQESCPYSKPQEERLCKNSTCKYGSILLKTSYRKSELEITNKTSDSDKCIEVVSGYNKNRRELKLSVKGLQAGPKHKNKVIDFNNPKVLKEPKTDDSLDYFLQSNPPKISDFWKFLEPQVLQQIPVNTCDNKNNVDVKVFSDYKFKITFVFPPVFQWDGNWKRSSVPSINEKVKESKDKSEKALQEKIDNVTKKQIESKLENVEKAQRKLKENQEAEKEAIKRAYGHDGDKEHVKDELEKIKSENYDLYKKLKENQEHLNELNRKKGESSGANEDAKRKLAESDQKQKDADDKLKDIQGQREQLMYESQSGSRQVDVKNEMASLDRQQADLVSTRNQAKQESDSLRSGLKDTSIDENPPIEVTGKKGVDDHKVNQVQFEYSSQVDEDEKENHSIKIKEKFGDELELKIDDKVVFKPKVGSLLENRGSQFKDALKQLKDVSSIKQFLQLFSEVSGQTNLGDIKIDLFAPGIFFDFKGWREVENSTKCAWSGTITLCINPLFAVDARVDLVGAAILVFLPGIGMALAKIKDIAEKLDLMKLHFYVGTAVNVGLQIPTYDIDSLNDNEWFKEKVEFVGEAKLYGKLEVAVPNIVINIGVEGNVDASWKFDAQFTDQKDLVFFKKYLGIKLSVLGYIEVGGLMQKISFGLIKSHKVTHQIYDHTWTQKDDKFVEFGRLHLSKYFN